VAHAPLAWGRPRWPRRLLEASLRAAAGSGVPNAEANRSPGGLVDGVDDARKSGGRLLSRESMCPIAPGSPCWRA
jgi:hypothetical protein